MRRLLPNGNSTLKEYEPFLDVDFIVTDIDGTLTVGSAPLLQQIREKIKSLRRKNVYTTVATGRTYVGARKMIQDLSIENGTPIILYNGGLLIEHNTDNVLSLNEIPINAVEQILSIAQSVGVGVFVYTFDLKIKDFIDITNTNHICEKVYYSGHRNVKIDINGSKALPYSRDRIIQEKVLSMLVVKRELDDETYDKLMKYMEFSDEISYTDSGSGFIEVKAPIDTKALIVQEIKKRRGKKKYGLGKILGIGDNDNDVDLFSSSDISVAVANSSENAKKYADYICANENAKGFLDMLIVLERAKYYLK